MKTDIQGGPSFAHIHVQLEPGETFITESGAMASMDAALEMKARFNGGFIAAIFRKLLGGESLFVSLFTNKSEGIKSLIVVQSTPGDISEIPLNGNTIYLQPGSFVAATQGVKLNLKWAGFTSFIAREGLFRLAISGQGKVFVGAFGGFVTKAVDGEYIVDTGHLVAYEPSIKLNLKLAGGFFSSFFSGEGFVARLSGKGNIILQTRSLPGLVSWLNPKLY